MRWQRERVVRWRIWDVRDERVVWWVGVGKVVRGVGESDDVDVDDGGDGAEGDGGWWRASV